MPSLCCRAPGRQEGSYYLDEELGKQEVIRMGVNNTHLDVTLCHLSHYVNDCQGTISPTGIPMDRERSVNSVTQR